MKAAYLPVLLGVLLAVSGCASLSPGPQNVERSAPFDVLGRVLVSTPGNAFTANVRWVHAADADEIWLMTPTGQVLAQMREDAEGATLTTAERKQYRAARIESLTQQALGWALPMSRLQHWLRGSPVPNIPAEIAQRDAAGRVRLLVQDGWRISYEYYPAKENDGLPRRVEAAGAAQTLRLVIDTWRRDTPSGNP